jgi:23S rRNA pseudouridine1911/1915/1917 synthase
MVVHPGAGNYKDTLVNGLIYKYKNGLSDVNGSVRPGIVHRIDKETSGLLVVAKNNLSHSNLGKQFSDHSIKRRYKCLAWGVIRPLNGRIETLISRNKKNRQLMTVSDVNGKKAITNYNTIKVFNIKDIPKISLIECELETGRTHQIRVHSTFLGHPIFGDEKYGGGASRAKGFLPEYTKIYNKKVRELNRHALHAEEIEILHPVKNKNMIFKAPLPIELLNLTKSLETLYEE